ARQVQNSPQMKAPSSTTKLCSSVPPCSIHCLASLGPISCEPAQRALSADDNRGPWCGCKRLANRWVHMTDPKKLPPIKTAQVSTPTVDGNSNIAVTPRAWKI